MFKRRPHCFLNVLCTFNFVLCPKKVFKRNNIYKSSYYKSVIDLFIWPIAFTRCSQLFVCVKLLFFAQNVRVAQRKSLVSAFPEPLKTGQKFTEQYCHSIFKKIKHITLKFQRLIAKTLASYISKTKTLFVNLDEKEY